jgi:uncharacterized protein (DUF58 family)
MTTSLRIVLVLLAVCLLAGASTGNRLYYQLVYLWLFLLLVSRIWSYYSVRGISITRNARTLRAQVGQVFEERFEIKNNSRIPRLWVEIKDTSGLPNSEGSRVLTVIEPNQSRSYLARTRLTERGSFQLGPTTLASGDFFGLFPVEVMVPANEMLLVYPQLVEIQNFPNPPGLLPGGEALRRRTQQVTPNAAGVREYINGDPLNRIHWLSSARRNSLMVKEFELDPLADVWIFLDAQGDIQSNRVHEPTESYPIQALWQRDIKIKLPPKTGEYAVSAAASLSRHYLRRGRAVGFVAAGLNMNLLPPDRGGRQLGKILEALALLRLEGQIPLRGLVETQAKHIARGSTIIIITPSTANDTPMVFEFLTRRGLRPIAVMIDSASFGGLEGTGMITEQIKTLGVPVRTLICDVALTNSLSS